MILRTKARNGIVLTHRQNFAHGPSTRPFFENYSISPHKPIVDSSDASNCFLQSLPPTPAHRGRTTQVWDANVARQSDGKPIALFRCTQMILWPKPG